MKTVTLPYRQVRQWTPDLVESMDMEFQVIETDDDGAPIRHYSTGPLHPDRLTDEQKAVWDRYLGDTGLLQAQVKSLTDALAAAQKAQAETSSAAEQAQADISGHAHEIADLKMQMANATGELKGREQAIGDLITAMRRTDIDAPITGAKLAEVIVAKAQDMALARDRGTAAARELAQLRAAIADMPNGQDLLDQLAAKIEASAGEPEGL